MNRALRLRSWLLLLVAGLIWSALDPFSAWSESSSQAVVLSVQGPIGPATSDYVTRGLERARERNAGLVILRMDTPGGLDTSMRAIIQAIIDSPVPVASYVAPGGARAASAGTYILYASHIAAMAPGTNLGAATPVQIIGGGQPDPLSPSPDKGGDSSDSSPKDKQDGKADEPEKSAAGGDSMKKKMVNDAVAYIRSLAKLRGRNADWAEKAVREAASLPASEALEKNVIDLVAQDIGEVLDKAHGREVDVGGRTVALETKGMGTTAIEPGWRYKLLSVITNPNVAYVLMLIGIYGLFFEFSNPGFILPGVAGAICLVLALYAFHVLPVNYAGLGLILLGIIFMVAEVFAPSFGALGIGGIVAFVIGSIILMDTESPFFAISIPLIAAVALVSAGLFMGVLGMVLKSRMRPVVSGQEAMIGATGEAVEDFEERGRVRVQGEIWHAVSHGPVQKGQRVRVTALHGLTVEIERLEKEGMR